MIAPTKHITRAGKGFNIIACAAVIVMMMLSATDVFLRLFGKPIPGAYEMVGFLGTIVVSFALAYTSIEKGHIAVEILVGRFSLRAQFAIETVTNFISFMLFGLITWQSFIYALDIRKSGEVSMTLQMPVYPFLLAMAIGFGLLCILLIADFIKSLQRTFSR